MQAKGHGAPRDVCLPGKVQAAVVEVDGVDEGPFVAKSLSGVLHPLNLGVHGFAGDVGDAVAQLDHDVGGERHCKVKDSEAALRGSPPEVSPLQHTASPL